MAKRSDFAQKLLDDLRLRKERMAASQNTKGSNAMVADAYAYSRSTYKSSREPKAVKASGFRAGSTQNRPSGGKKSFTTGQTSNQIVPFGGGHKAEQMGDLSMALTFALENGGKIRTESSRNSSIFSFLQNIGRRQMDYGKMERGNRVVSRHQPSSSQLPTLSHIHIEEISRGAQKLNQILRACSNGLNFDRYSIEIGQELLKGAMDLQESLKLLVGMQEASDYLITPQRKSRLTLLEEDEDDDENTITIADQKQLSRPRFSFDRPSRKYNDIQEVAKTELKLRLAALTYSTDVPNSKHEKKGLGASNLRSHKRSVSCGTDVKTLSVFSEQNHSSSPQSKQEKSRIPNVIARLMGIEELPGNVDSKVSTKKESGNQKLEGTTTKKPAKGSTKKAEQREKDSTTSVLPPAKQKATLPSKIPLVQDTVTSQAGKTLATRNGSTRVDVHDKLPPRKDLEDVKPVISLRKGMIKVDKRQSDSAQLNHNSGSRKEIQERNHDSIKHREQKYTERSEIKGPVFKDEMQQMIPYMHKRSESTLTLLEKPEYGESMLHGENSSANKLRLGNQQKLQNNHGFQQVHMLQKSEPQEKKRQPEEREQEKQKLQEKKQKRPESVSSNISKLMSGATDLQKKQLQLNQAATSRKGSTEHTDATQLNGLVNGRHQENPAGERSSRNLNFKIKDSLSRNSSQHSTRGDVESESAKARIPFAVDEKPVQVQTTINGRRAKGHKLEAPRNIDEAKTKKSANVYNMPRTMKNQSSNLQERKQTRQEKPAISREADHEASRFEEAETQIIRPNVSVASPKSSLVAQELQTEAQKDSILQSRLEDECQGQNEEQVLATKHSCQNTVPTFTKEQKKQEPGFGRDDEHEVKDSVSDPLQGTREESTENFYIPQPQNQRTSIAKKPEPLTESENHLKRILLKSQLFMNTAEALFKLNIPISILHSNSYDHHIDQDSKLVLDCGYEVMKRKGRRQELSVHPFLKVPITSNKAKSLDELIKQMCKDFDKLKLYGKDGREDSPFEDYQPKMLEADVNNKEPDLNCMWDLGWNNTMFGFLEKDDVIKDVEKYVLNGLLDEITRELFTSITVTV
ncbi:hypothetical protein ERO13_A06G010500v2 [Gossypium hirsutum]|uniref:Muscle M-line assembly protein unc-89 n=1 Tax=Gossypium hirsutum TaxID=3635 RepID=A0A1U8MLG2_GOSHI|nr:muscle M-line assembly protein unc-89-like [Gossypium hirsutum]KAG4193744.1 hypothetical protein ERO13_A06G010500v2 [Gossypium hirsutum]